MRELHVKEITDAVARLCVEANRELPADLEQKIQNAAETEHSALGRAVLCDLCENMQAARRLGLPVCQDTGMAVDRKSVV